VTDAAPAEPDLRAARERILAVIAGSPMSRTPPQARAAAPLRPLPPELEARLPGRALTAAPDPAATVSARRVVLPATLLALLDLVGVTAGLSTGHYVLAVIAGILFVPLAGIAGIGAGLLRRRPARLTGPERRAIAAASRWDSKQAWTGPIEFCQERGLVIAAAREAERIVSTPGWRSGALGEQRVRLDLVAELDQIDAQAHRIALARHVDRSDSPAVDQAWDTAVDRVAALASYADNLRGLSGPANPARESDLLAGSAGDELALERLAALTVFLDAGRGEPFG
jgi:hypothetical protein